MSKKEYSRDDIRKLEEEADRKIFFSGKVYLDRLSGLLEDNKYLIFYTVFFLVAIFLLVYGYFNLASKITIRVDIPPKLYRTGTLYVGSSRANSLYYRVWGDYVVDQLGNYSPYSVTQHVKNVAYMYDPQTLGEAEPYLQDLIDYARSNLITHSFVPAHVDVSDDGLYKATGYGKSVIGDNLSVAYEQCEYTVQMKVEDYHLFVEYSNIHCRPLPKDDFMAGMDELRKKKKEKLARDISRVRDELEEEAKRARDAKILKSEEKKQ